MKKKNPLYYEHYVRRIEELTAMLYFMCTNDELEEYERKALAGIYGQLEEVKDGIEELFNLACNVEEELKRLRKKAIEG